MLRTRVISAAVLLAIVAVPFLLGGWPFLLLIVAAGALGAWEYTSLFRQGGALPLPWLCILLTVLFIVQAQWSHLSPFSALLTLAVIGSLIAVLWHKSPQPATDWALTLAGALYLGWLLRRFVLLRADTDGLSWLLLGALSIWAADVTAYFAGRAFGRWRSQHASGIHGTGVRRELQLGRSVPTGRGGNFTASEIPEAMAEINEGRVQAAQRLKDEREPSGRRLQSLPPWPISRSAALRRTPRGCHRLRLRDRRDAVRTTRRVGGAGGRPRPEPTGRRVPATSYRSTSPTRIR